jgi:general secretion pathway protein K
MTRFVLVWKHAASARGSGLIAVVFALLLIAAITGSLVTQTRTDLALSRNLELGVENDLSVEAGIVFAIFNLSDPDNKDPFIADGRAYHVDIDGNRLSLQIQSEAGKINLNQSPNPLLFRLLLSCAGEKADLLSKAIAAHIMAENGAAKVFLTIDELKRLPGASEEFVSAIEPFVSVYNFRAEPDFNLAPERLKALITESQTRTAPDALAAPGRASLNRSGIYTITASLRDSAAGASIRSIIYFTGDKREPYFVLDWRRVASRRQITSRESVVCEEVQSQ